MALMPVAEALERVLADAAPLPSHHVPLMDALGCVLAATLTARRTQPPAAVSAMDGYAVRGSDVATAPVTLQLVGEIAAGHPFDGVVGDGQAARIFTGGIMPRGADTVVIQELTQRDGQAVTITAATKTGRNVRAAAIDFTEGEALLAKGRRLTGRDLMLAAAMNHSLLPVIRRPKIAVLGTGDELVMPGSVLDAGDIVYSNGFALMAMVRTEGAQAIDLGIVRDSVDDIAAAVDRARAAEADILLTSGGASVGEHDLVQSALTGKGMKLSFWRVALRPGRPMLYGRLGAMHVLGVPGNPVSSYVCAFLFLVPLIRKLAGRTDLVPVPVAARLGTDLPANDERADYLRAVLSTGTDDLPIATPLPSQDSSLMAPLAKADCLVIRQSHTPAATAGSICTVLKLGS